ncbi:protein of unknown function [Methanoculleus bourgensis]|uniref:Uncharacterized protein n=1 Tax=Methanoculleus bourgensis TaxID=83986 RepID=A0A0X3BK77_9EURY|nr:protein of unknown function [Methanoculleus bourgensis]
MKQPIDPSRASASGSTDARSLNTFKYIFGYITHSLIQRSRNEAKSISNSITCLSNMSGCKWTD